jgi:uncharacterized phage-associated protein
VIPFIHGLFAIFAKLAKRYYAQVMYAKKHTNNPAYNARKAAQVLAYFASKTETKTINVLYVIKLIYLSDRKALQRLGMPILNELRVAMDHGPVNSQTFDNIKQNDHAVDLERWSEFVLPRQGHFVKVREVYTDDQLDELSEAELGVLDSVWNQFRHMKKWQLRDWTHLPQNVPEYEEPPAGTRTNIELADLCKEVGLSSENLEEIEAFASVDEAVINLRLNASLPMSVCGGEVSSRPA